MARVYKKSAAGTLSRQVSLQLRALETGTWMTGRPVNRDAIAARLAQILNAAASASEKVQVNKEVGAKLLAMPASGDLMLAVQAAREAGVIVG